jgi:hypothetical protein
MLLAISIDSEAYMDPGTGSMMLQLLLGGIAAISVAIRLYWHKIMAALGLRKKKKSEDELA